MVQKFWILDQLICDGPEVLDLLNFIHTENLDKLFIHTENLDKLFIHTENLGRSRNFGPGVFHSIIYSKNLGRSRKQACREIAA
jgi:hypothetical protein